MTYLNLKQLVEDDPDVRNIMIGETYKCAHTTCDEASGGVDHKKRLYITRKDTALYLGYCQHCGAKGSYRPQVIRKPSGVRRKAEARDLYAHGDEPSSILAKAWMHNNGITQDDVHRYGIREADDRLILPIRDLNGKLIGYQARRLRNDDSQKYLTKWYDSDEKLPFIGKSRQDVTHTVVICEDIASAMRISRLRGLVGVACLGVSLGAFTGRTLNSITNPDLPQHVAVWLDNDNPHVRKARRVILDKLTTMLDNVPGVTIEYVTTDTKDPKHCSESEVYRTLAETVIVRGE